MKTMLNGVTKGLPQTGLQGGAGAGVFYLHRMLSSKVAFLQNHPLAAPIGFVVLGHILKKKGKLAAVGAALVGAGGYAGAQVYELAKATAAANTPATPPAAAGTSGFDDTGMLVPTGDIGMLLQPGDVGGYMNPSNDASSYSDAYEMQSA